MRIALCDDELIILNDIMIMVDEFIEECGYVGEVYSFNGGEELLKKLEQKKVQTRPIWFLSHLQKPYLENQSYRIEKAYYYWERVLNLPCSTNLTEKEVMWVARCIREIGEEIGT